MTILQMLFAFECDTKPLKLYRLWWVSKCQMAAPRLCPLPVLMWDLTHTNNIILHIINPLAFADNLTLFLYQCIFIVSVKHILFITISIGYIN